jgi:hypothetical protein
MVDDPTILFTELPLARRMRGLIRTLVDRVPALRDAGIFNGLLENTGVDTLTDNDYVPIAPNFGSPQRALLVVADRDVSLPVF